MRKHGAEVLNSGEPNNVSCWRSADGEATSVGWCRSSTLCGTFGERRHGEPNNVSCWRSTRRHGRAAGEREFDEK